MTRANAQYGSGRFRLLNSRWFWISAAVGFVLLIFAANAHLVVVAMNSQPACVVHDKVADSSTSQLRAAKSGC